jgi:hypothetical protein
MQRQAARHQTARTAGVRSEDYWDHQPGQRVMTCDGYPGRVSAVRDGPFPGSEDYEVVLDGGLGGGIYSSGQLRPVSASPATAAAHESSEVHTADLDYPELGSVLFDRPDPATHPGHPFAKSATTINGEQIDHHGDAPDEVRAAGPNDYDSRSTEGDGDEEFNSPLSRADQKRYDAAQSMTYQSAPGGMPPVAAALGRVDERMAERHLLNQHGWTPGSVHRAAESGDLLSDLHIALHDAGAANHDHDGPDLPHEAAFEVTARWSDVLAKARRIRAEGRVRITLARRDMTIGEVKGDHHVYETGIQHTAGRADIGYWSCGCKWASWHQAAVKRYRDYSGRPCSHVMALHLEAQSRGRQRVLGPAGGENKPPKPEWVPSRVVVNWDIDDQRNEFARSSGARLGHSDDPAFDHPDDSDDLDYYDTPQGNSWKGTGDWAHLSEPAPEPYAARHRDASLDPAGSDNPVSPDLIARTGPAASALTGRTMPAGFLPSASPGRMASAGISALGSANDPWGDSGLHIQVENKPYGATSPPNKWESPASAGFLSAADPVGWGDIEAFPDANTRAPRNTGSRHGVVLDKPETPYGGVPAEPENSSHAGPAGGANGPLSPKDPDGMSSTSSLHEAMLCLAMEIGTQDDGGTGHDPAGYTGDTAELHGRPEPALPETTGGLPGQNPAWPGDDGGKKMPPPPPAEQAEQDRLHAAFWDAMDHPPAKTAERTMSDEQARAADAGKYAHCGNCGYRGPAHSGNQFVCPSCGQNAIDQLGPFEHVGALWGDHLWTTAQGTPGDQGDQMDSQMATGNPVGAQTANPAMNPSGPEPIAPTQNSSPAMAGPMPPMPAATALPPTIALWHLAGDDDGDQELGPLATPAQSSSGYQPDATSGEDDAKPDMSVTGAWYGSIMAGTERAGGPDYASPGGGDDAPPGGQYGGPGTGQHDEDLSPEDTSIQTVGYTAPGDLYKFYNSSRSAAVQESGGNDEISEPQLRTDDLLGDQTSGTGEQLSLGSLHGIPFRGEGTSDGDIAKAARMALQKLSMDTFTDAEARELINEGRGKRASNLDQLDLEGTHFKELEAKFLEAGLDPDDDVIWLSA